nr:DUF1661 domain-containing protein [Porphyromonas gingivalis]
MRSVRKRRTANQKKVVPEILKTRAKKKFVLVREFFCSRTKTKKFSDHVLRSYTRQNLRTKKRAR